ncbi:MAG: N-acetylmuramoyl-L-alanine amidase family protein [Akkermansiaceae bacterium]
MLKRHFIGKFIAVLLGIIVSSSSALTAASFKWNEVKLKGEDYVTLKNVKDFYFFTKMTPGAKITLENAKWRMELKSGSQECRLNGVLFVMSSPIVAYKGNYLMSKTDLVKLIDPVFRPAHIGNAKPFNTVVIDPGHGGHDSGGKGVFSNEKVYALNVAKLLRDKLQAKGYKVVMTRDKDVFISLKNRVKIANSFPNAVFISIHFNSANVSAHGIETFTVSPVGVPHMGRGVRANDYNMVPGNIVDSASIALATAAHSRSLLYLNNAKFGNDFKVKDRGIKRARFNVLQGIKIPAILFEGGFVSNRIEAGKIHSAAYQQTLATALSNAVDIYRNSVSKRRP